MGVKNEVIYDELTKNLAESAQIIKEILEVHS